jgi:N-acetyl-anhydromuramoyl-L-alanine amidase
MKPRHSQRHSSGHRRARAAAQLSSLADRLHRHPRPRWAQWHSPNHNARPAAARIDTVVIHNIQLPPQELGARWVRAFFTNHLPAHKHPYFEHLAGVRVSAHFYIARNAKVVQCVPLHRRAWHAGVSQLHTPEGVRENLNNTSIGIELAGSDHLPYTNAQYAALRRVLLQLHEWLPLRFVVGHCDIAPGRKTDPGASFDWARLARSLPPSVAASLQFRGVPSAV